MPTNAVNDPQTAVRQAGTSLNASLARPAGQSKESLGKEDFLKLLMAQATHQDPLNPMDSQGMMNQLTSMGSLEQMINMNKQLGQLTQLEGDVARANTYAFLDKDVMVRGGTATVAQGATPSLQFQLPREAQNVQVSVLDKGGTLVRVLDLGGQGTGRHSIAWDAKDKDGDPVPDGTYHYQVAALSPDHDALPVELYVRGKVAGIRFDPNGRGLLKINGEEVDPREVVEITNRSQRLFDERQPLPLRQNLSPQPPRLERKK